MRCRCLFLRIAVILRKSPSTHVGVKKVLEKFFATLKHQYHVHQNSFFEGLKGFHVVICLWGSMKSQKLPLTHVLIFIIRLRYRTMSVFVSTDSYDPKEASKHICWVVECIRKFFRDTQRQRPRSLKHSFWTILDASNGFYLWKGYENSKITVTLRLRS